MSVQIAERGRPLGNPWQVWLKFRLVPFLGAALVRILCYTLRVTYRGEGAVEDLVRSDSRFILAFYHRRLVMMPLAYPFRRNNLRGERRGVATLVSDSKDGEITASAYNWLGIQIVRGTATHSGVQALMRMVRAIRDGWDMGITVDGPKGPAQEVKAGALAVSRMTGAYLVPVCVAFENAWQLGTWDRMLLPKPFSRVVVGYAEPWQAPSENEEASRQKLQGDLDGLEAWAKTL